MFNLGNVTNKKLIGLTTLHGFLYTLFNLILPCIFVAIEYDLLLTNVEASTKLTGVGIIVLLIFVFVGLGKLKAQVDEIPIDAQIWKSKTRAILKFIYSMILPVIILVIVFFIKENMIKATAVIQSSVISIMFGSLENCILGSSVQRENAIRGNASKQKEAKSREDKV